MTLSVDDATVELARLRRGQAWAEWLFGVLCGTMIAAAINGQGEWWHYALSFIGGLSVVANAERVNRGIRALDLAVERRDEWRRERWEELHEGELAAYRETIARLMKELEDHGQRRLN